MKVVIDIEADALVNPKHIWLIVAKDIDTGEYTIFRNVTEDAKELKSFVEFSKTVTQFIGHNVLGYDLPVLSSLCPNSGFDCSSEAIINEEILEGSYTTIRWFDTLILSKLVDYSRQGHSIEDYGLEFGIPKGRFVDFSKYSQEMEDYCVRDVDICEKIYRKYTRYINNPEHQPSIVLEHRFQLVVNSLHSNGFCFNATRAASLLERVTRDLSALDKDILEAFPPKLKLIREITPKETKHGTLSKTDFRWVTDGDLTDYNGGPFCRCSWEPFNPSSHKQIITVLSQAGWSPTDRTQTHIDTERSYNQLKYRKGFDTEKKVLYDKLQSLKKSGWRINENNLETLPAKAPIAARLLAKRILLESRRRTLTEWLGLVQADGRIHGKFNGLGAWTHRMNHQSPNTANIPNEFDTAGKKKLLGKELRSLWCAPKNRLLVGVDAEGIQLRIFAHLIDDAEFTLALVKGKKDDKTDPHSLNQRILGSVCRSRAAAKRFIYALLLGAGLDKLAEILGCSRAEAEEALNYLLERYTGFATLKSTLIPKDASRGWFVGLDGRRVRIPGETEGSRRHLAMSGYLQNGEQIIVKDTTIRTLRRMANEGYEGKLVNVVHDEVIFEVPNDVRRAEEVSNIFCEEIVTVGVDLNLRCPLAGDGHVGLNWYEIH